MNIKEERLWKRLNEAVLIAGLTATAGIMLVASGWRQPNPLLMLFVLWACSPMVVSWLILRKGGWPFISYVLFLAGHLSMVGLAGVIYWQAFFVHPDPQSALVFLVIPAWQWGILLASAGLAALGMKFKRSEG